MHRIGDRVPGDLDRADRQILDRRIGDEDIAVAELERRAARGPIGLPQAEIVDDEIEPAFGAVVVGDPADRLAARIRSEEHTSELQSLMRISYAVFCLKKKKTTNYKIKK